MLHLVNARKPDAVSSIAFGARRQRHAHPVQDDAVALIDYIKSAGATALYTMVGEGDRAIGLEVSSLMDTWIALENVRREDDLERRIHVVKSRGMPHSPTCASSRSASTDL